MAKILSFFQQQVFPGFYTEYVNKKFISKNYDSQQHFNVDISAVVGNEKDYIEQLEKDLENQLDRKKRIEDKAKSLLFIIAVVVTAITFSLTYLKSLQLNIYQAISILILFFSVIYLVFGAIRALQALNIRQFHITQANIDNDNNKFILNVNQSDIDYLKDIIKSKRLNDLINIRLSNYTYASFNLIRNGIILFVVFFISTISFSYLSNSEKASGTHLISKKIKVEINDSIRVDLPYSFEINYDVKNLELNKK
jgi:hypothetical protein